MSAPKQPRKSLRADARALVDSCPASNLRLAARRLTQFLEQHLDGSGLSVAQLSLMARIAAAEDDTLGALARRTGLDQSTLSRNLRTLETRGLVEIAIVEADQRRRVVWLTETGARKLEAAIPLWRRAQAALTGRFPSDLARSVADRSEALAEN